MDLWSNAVSSLLSAGFGYGQDPTCIFASREASFHARVELLPEESGLLFWILNFVVFCADAQSSWSSSFDLFAQIAATGSFSSFIVVFVAPARANADSSAFLPESGYQ